jgi:ribose-phosphate pyrophosphokinase
MDLSIFSGRANPGLAQSVAALLKIKLGRCEIEEFPDHELHIVVLENLQGHDVYVIQPTHPPAADHLLELLLLADAVRRAGAGRLTAVIPYFGYARQDRRYAAGEPVTARLIADLLSIRFNRVITVDLHNAALEGFFAIPVEHLSAVPLLAQRLRPLVTKNTILVAPDLGAVKLAQAYADLLDLPVAYIQKVRLSGDEVSVRGMIGEVTDRIPLVVDDMISTGGTIVSALRALLECGARQPITVVATHGLLSKQAGRKLSERQIIKVILTDSIGRSDHESLNIEWVGLDRLLAETIQRLHQNFGTHDHSSS